ncbi:MAG: recombination protein O N-terminal domain-containing protein [Holosporales bacterium]|nr:recombination protein O N-terminal domain-containing protein [Holosporales bacterium]
MRWEDTAIILKTAKFGERSCIVTVLSQQHGMHKGLLKYGAPPLLGDIVHAAWAARLREQLGGWRLDVEFSYSAFFMRDKIKLSVFVFLCEVLCVLLDERTPYEHVFNSTISLLEKLRTSKLFEEWIVDYLQFEDLLLKQAGFGYCESTNAINACITRSSQHLDRDGKDIYDALMSNGALYEQILDQFPWVNSFRRKMIEDIIEMLAHSK